MLIDNFDVANFEKSDLRFDIWLDEKKVQMREDKKNSSVISHGFGEYHTIQDFPIRGRATYLHVRKRKWLDKDTGEIFSYEWELSEYDETHRRTRIFPWHTPLTAIATLRTGKATALIQRFCILCRRRKSDLTLRAALT